MTMVPTVLGPIPVSQLGLVLMHEHVLLCTIGWAMDGRNSYDREQVIQSVSERLAAVSEYGVKTIVDPTTVDLGRDLGFVMEVSRRSGVNIVASTGLFKEDTGLPVYFRDQEIDDIARWMVWELTEGMSGTGIRAGVIKVATGFGQFGRHEEKVFRAAARAHRSTGAPILTHTDAGTLGKEQVDVFEDECVDVARVIVGHCCCNDDLSYHLGLLKRGVNIGIDRIGLVHKTPDETRRRIVKSVFAAGYASQVMLSQDTVGVFYGAPPHYVRGVQGQPPRAYTDIMTDFIPRLREEGVSDRSIDVCLAELPRKLFGG